MASLHQATVDEKKQRELYDVCRYGHRVDVERIVEAGGVSVRHSDDAGLTLLHHACQGNNFWIVEELLGQTDGVYRRMLYKKTNDGETPLGMACRLGHADFVRVLVSKRASVYHRMSRTGEVPLHVACGHGHDAVVLELLQHENIKVNIIDHILETPLHKACARGHVNVVGILVDNHADVNCRSNFGDTPLHLAVKNFNFDIILMLIHTDPDVDVKDKRGLTALHLACLSNKVYAVGALAKQGADPNMTIANTLFTPLHSACQSGQVILVNMLVNSGAHLDVIVGLGRTPLFLASHKGYGDIVSFLLSRGARIFGQHANNPIQVAIRGQHTYVVNVLIAHLIRRCQAKGISMRLISRITALAIQGITCVKN